MNKKLLVVAGALSTLPLMAGATAPAWVGDAFTAAQTTITDYLAAAAPVGATLTVTICAFYFVLKLIRKISH